MEHEDRTVVAGTFWPPKGTIQRWPGQRMRMGLLLIINPDESHATLPCDPEIVTMFSEVSETVELPDGAEMVARKYVGEYADDMDVTPTYMGPGDWSLSPSSVLPVEMPGWPSEWDEGDGERVDLLDEMAYVTSNKGWEALRESVVAEVGDSES